MPWRSITLVPFQRRGEFSGGNTSEENSDIEFVSERHAGPLQFSGMSSDERETQFGDFVSDANSVSIRMLLFLKGSLQLRNHNPVLALRANVLLILWRTSS